MEPTIYLHLEFTMSFLSLKSVKAEHTWNYSHMKKTRDSSKWMTFCRQQRVSKRMNNQWNKNFCVEYSSMQISILSFPITLEHCFLTFFITKSFHNMFLNLAHLYQYIISSGWVFKHRMCSKSWLARQLFLKV